MEAWLFPGQGAQRAGMGVELLGRFPDHRDVADKVLGYSILEVCRGSVPDGLRRTEFVQPALFVVNALSYLARQAVGPRPDFLAGHSLGELNALWAAGCFDFEAGLRLVRRRGELMGQADGGAMTAVVGLAEERVRDVLGRSGIEDVDVANLNAPEQLVLAGPADAIGSLVAALRSAGGRCVPLNVSAAFHSRQMAGAAEALGAELAGMRFSPPEIPVIANVTARPYPAEGVGELLARQLTSPVRWRDSMRTLASLGVRRIVEIGPGSVLTRLWQDCAADRPVARAPGTAHPPRRHLVPERLGSAEFRRDYGVRLTYLAGSMYRGIASTDLVIRMGRAGLLGFFGAGGLPLPAIDEAITTIRAGLGGQANFGVNLLGDLERPEVETDLVELYLRQDVRFVEAAAYTRITPALVRFRFSGAGAGPLRRIVAKVSRPEVAAAFMSPAPEAIVEQLVRDGRLTEAEAAMARALPVSEDICAEADSAGHTDGAVALTLVPAFARLRDDITREHGYRERIRVGASGGLGSPEAVAAAFVLGADFVVTGSVNQCTAEAGTSALVKDMLAELDVRDTAYAPAGDMFELGARVQVMRKGTLFAARANKLYQLYRSHERVEDIDRQTRTTLERSYFRRSLAEVWDRAREHHLADGRADVLARAEENDKLRMALLFRWYFADTTLAALAGRAEDRANFQVHCGPAMGAFNRFAAGSSLARWPDRHVDEIAERLMGEAARLLPRDLSASTSSP